MVRAANSGRGKLLNCIIYIYVGTVRKCIYVIIRVTLLVAPAGDWAPIGETSTRLPVRWEEVINFALRLARDWSAKGRRLEGFREK